MESLRDLLLDELSDLRSAESQLIKALPKMAESAASPELRQACEEHLAVTRGHLERLDQIFSEIDSQPKRKVCKGMKGLIEEGKELMREAEPSPVLDAGLIGAAQRVEHYEISGYGTARTHADELGERQAAELLDQIRAEEQGTDKTLTQLAERRINVEAAS